MGRLTGLLGLITMLGLAYLFSSNRRAIRVKTVVTGLVLQFVFALFVLRFSFGVTFWNGQAMESISSCNIPSPAHKWSSANWAGRAGSLVSSSPSRFSPTVIFISAFFAVLYHYGIMQFIIRQAAKVMIRMGASGAESLDVAASIFMGQTEARLPSGPISVSLAPS